MHSNQGRRVQKSWILIEYLTLVCPGVQRKKTRHVAGRPFLRHKCHGCIVGVFFLSGAAGSVTNLRKPIHRACSMDTWYAPMPGCLAGAAGAAESQSSHSGSSCSIREIISCKLALRPLLHSDVRRLSHRIPVAMNGMLCVPSATPGAQVED